MQPCTMLLPFASAPLAPITSSVCYVRTRTRAVSVRLQEPWLIALLLCQAALFAAIVLFRQNQTFTAAVFASIGELVAACMTLPFLTRLSRSPDIFCFEAASACETRVVACIHLVGCALEGAALTLLLHAALQW